MQVRIVSTALLIVFLVGCGSDKPQTSSLIKQRAELSVQVKESEPPMFGSPSLFGEVVNSKTGEPVANMDVTARYQDNNNNINKTTTTNADGAFQIERVPRGINLLSADKEGYVVDDKPVTVPERIELKPVQAPVGTEIKWGYMDAKTNQFVINAIYDKAGEFEKGHAYVEIDGKNFLIYASGEIGVKLIYDEVGSFREGLAAIRKGDKWGFIDKTGKIVVPLRYSDVRYSSDSGLGYWFEKSYGASWHSVPGFFREGLAAVRKGNLKDNIITSSTDLFGRRSPQKLEFSGPDPSVTPHNAPVGTEIKWGFIDKTGKVIVPLRYSGAGSFREGLAAVKKGDKWGFIDKTGKVIVPMIYDDVEPFSDGLAMVRKGDYKTGKYGFIGKTGKVVIPMIYDDAKPFSDGLAVVVVGKSLDEKYGFIDKMGKMVTPLIYQEAESFSEGLAAVENESYREGFIDRAGKVVIPFEYSTVQSFGDGLALVTTYDNSISQKKEGFIDKTGKVVIPMTNVYARERGLDHGYRGVFSEGLVRTVEFGKSTVRGTPRKWAFADKTGSVVIPQIYDQVFPFSEGLAGVKKGDKWGFIDKTGRSPY